MMCDHVCRERHRDAKSLEHYLTWDVLLCRLYVVALVAGQCLWYGLFVRGQLREPLQLPLFSNRLWAHSNALLGALEIPRTETLVSGAPVRVGYESRWTARRAGV
jgi:hypothetical protein